MSRVFMLLGVLFIGFLGGWLLHIVPTKKSRK
jgi:hypothetical protein